MWVTSLSDVNIFFHDFRQSAPAPNASHTIGTDASHHGVAMPKPVNDGRPFALVVDDTPVMQLLMKKLLEDFGYRVITAQDGYDALLKYRQHAGELELVVTDLCMPRMDGLDLVDVLFRLDRALPVVVASATLDADTGAELRALGVTSMLKKPFTREQFRAATEEAHSRSPRGRPASLGSG